MSDRAILIAFFGLLFMAVAAIVLGAAAAVERRSLECRALGGVYVERIDLCIDPKVVVTK